MPRRPVAASAVQESKSLVEKSVETREKIKSATSILKIPGVGAGSELAREVEAVPTIFPHVDYRIGVGGYPISRLTTIQGPSNHGKTTYLVGLMRSFIEMGHYVLFGDMERTTPKSYLKLLMGEAFESPLFQMPEKLGNYTSVRTLARQWCEGIAKLRDEGTIPPTVTGMVAIDSLQNLLPDNMMDEMAKLSATERKGKKDGGADGLRGRGGQLQASWNKAWFLELTSVLADTRCAFVTIVRENVKDGEGFHAEDIITPVGGKEVLFGPSLRTRVIAQPLYEGEGKEKTMVGEIHTVQIVKTKVSGKEERIPEAFFHTSNGKSGPAGFDRARDVLELGKELGVIQTRGAHYYVVGHHSEHKIGMGANQALETLRNDEPIRLSVEALCKAKRGR